jgi:hypothetical protein
MHFLAYSRHKKTLEKLLLLRVKNTLENEPLI